MFGVGFGQQQQQQTGRGGEAGLQPFVPDFSGFSVGKTDERGYGLSGFGTQNQGQGQGYSTNGQAGGFYAGPSRQGYQHQEVPHQRPPPTHQPSTQPIHEPATGKISNTTLPPCPQIEDVTSWSNISFFISLHLRYQHCVVPILHKPTFNSDLALRLDRKDEQFRAFLLSLGEPVRCFSMYAGLMLRQWHM
jgi:hypothetical protein